MAQKIESIAEELFNKLHMRFENMTLGDEEGNTVTDPAQAKIFNFDFIDEAGTNFGNIEISIVSRDDVVVFYGSNMTSDLTTEQKADWMKFLKGIRFFAMRRGLTFSPSDITRSKSRKKAKPVMTHDQRVQHIAHKSPLSTDDNTVTESKLYGTAKVSYENISPKTQLIIRHSAPVNDEQRGARSRKIHSIHIGNTDGERFKSPFTNLRGSRALARHVDAGGHVYDPFGSHVIDMVKELNEMGKFIRGTSNKVFEDDEAAQLVSAAKERHAHIRSVLHRLTGARGYSQYKESWTPESELDTENLDALKEKFMVKSFNPKLEGALPYVARAQKSVNRPLDDFEDYLNEVESTGISEVMGHDHPIDFVALKKLMQTEILAGADGMNADGVFQDVLRNVSSDDLSNRFYTASQASPDTDVRPVIYDWLKDNLTPRDFEQFDQTLQGNDAQAAPEPTAEPEAVPAQPEVPSEQDSEPEQQPDAVSEMRRLAGLSK